MLGAGAEAAWAPGSPWRRPSPAQGGEVIAAMRYRPGAASSPTVPVAQRARLKQDEVDGSSADTEEMERLPHVGGVALRRHESSAHFRFEITSAFVPTRTGWRSA